MSKRIEKIVIVGGGTAGWMSAAFLNKVLGNATNRKISITVVESDDVGIIGVGEATIPGFRRMMRIIDIPEWRLFRDADASFKNAIKFNDWVHIPEPGQSSHYYHQFDPPLAADGYDAMTHWLALKDAGVDVPSLADAVSISAALSDAGHSPKTPDSEDYHSPLPYAYHVDTVKLGRLLREIAMERGVERFIDHVVKVNRTEDGDITSIDTRDGRKLEADLFIDCTGFRAVLIEGAMGEPFIDYTDRLFCDRAIAGQIDFAPGALPRPYTVASAKSAGWIWEIDLYHRTGMGYVYSSKFIDDDAAEAEMRAHIHPAIRDQLEPRRIQMRIGRRNKLWVNNCVAIGLSGGFIEPIESTGIHLCELGLIHLVDYIAEGSAREPLQRKYNALMRDVYDEIVNFIQLHYVFNKRHGQPFWDAYRDPAVRTPALAEQLEIWAHRMPTLTDLKSRINIFDFWNFFAVMGGVGALPASGNNISPFLNLKTSEGLMGHLAATRAQAVRATIPHVDILRKMRVPPT